MLFTTMWCPSAGPRCPACLHASARNSSSSCNSKQTGQSFSYSTLLQFVVVYNQAVPKRVGGSCIWMQFGRSNVMIAASATDPPAICQAWAVWVEPLGAHCLYRVVAIQYAPLRNSLLVFALTHTIAHMLLLQSIRVRFHWGVWFCYVFVGKCWYMLW